MGNKQRKHIRIEERTPTVEQYQSLRNQTGWYKVADKTVQMGLKHNVFSVVAFDGSNIVGMGRVVGDGAIYFYIQDIIVHKDYRNKGIGGLIMDHILHHLEMNVPRNAFVGLMAAKGTKKFYANHGFVERNEDSPGMFRILMERE